MKEEYREAMEKLSLSDDDKMRILANVKKAYEQSVEESSVSTDHKNVLPINRSRRFSPRRMGAVAAAFIVLCVSMVLIRNQQITIDPEREKERQGEPLSYGPYTDVVWEQYDSIKDIARKTDCKTYTLSKLPKKYKVKKVEVANAQRHVKITYHNKKDKDDILLEYKEESDSVDIKSQFSGESELATEKIDGSEVKMYGTKKCSGMTWEDDTCTFAVKMSRACSTDSARRIVSGTKQSGKQDTEVKNEKEEKDEQRLVNSNVVGWDGREKASGAEQKQKVLRKVYNQLGFRVMLHSPAARVTYKYIQDFESFAFYVEGEESLSDKWIIGYAGESGSPDGALTDYDETETVTVGEHTVTVYQRDPWEKILVFTIDDVCFTLFIDEYDRDPGEEILTTLLSVFEVSREEESEPTHDIDDKEETPDHTPEPGSKPSVDCRRVIQKIQQAVAEKSLTKLSSYISYPLDIDGLGETIGSASEFQSLDADLIFTPDWIDAILFCDTDHIKATAKSFTLGDSDNSLVCRVKGKSVVITELHVVVEDREPSDDDMDEDY